MIEDVYYQRGFPDPVFADDYVLSLARPFAPGAKAVTGVDETGGEARTYAIDGDIILKVQRPQQLRLSTSLEREVFFLRQLEKHDAGVSVPRVLGYGKEGTVEYTVMTRMRGDAVIRSELTAAQKSAVLYELGTQLARIHRLDARPFYESGLFPYAAKTAEDVGEMFMFMFERSLGWMRINLPQPEKDEACGRAAELAGRIKDAIAASCSVYIVPCHANPGPMHTFVDCGRYSGLIDFGDSYINHPVFDIRRWPIADRARILEGYKSEAETDAAFDEVYNISVEIDAIAEELQRRAAQSQQ